MKEAMRWNKRRVPMITLPKRFSVQLDLVLSRNPHREYSASILGMVYFAVLILKVWTKNQPHASFLRKIVLSHNIKGFVLNGRHQRPAVLITAKTLSIGLRAKSFGMDREEECLIQSTLPSYHDSQFFSRAKIRQN